MVHVFRADQSSSLYQVLIKAPFERFQASLEHYYFLEDPFLECNFVVLIATFQSLFDSEEAFHAIRPQKMVSEDPLVLHSPCPLLHPLEVRSNYNWPKMRRMYA